MRSDQVFKVRYPEFKIAQRRAGLDFQQRG